MSSTYDDLEKLVDLRNEGVITEAEFIKKKIEILGILENQTTTPVEDKIIENNIQPTVTINTEPTETSVNEKGNIHEDYAALDSSGVGIAVYNRNLRNLFKAIIIVVCLIVVIIVGYKIFPGNIAKDNSEVKITAPVAPQTEASEAVTTISPSSASGVAQKIKVIGNSDSKRYHLPGMKYYNDVKVYHRVEFDSEEDAIKAGYSKAPR